MRSSANRRSRYARRHLPHFQAEMGEAPFWRLRLTATVLLRGRSPRSVGRLRISWSLAGRPIACTPGALPFSAVNVRNVDRIPRAALLRRRTPDDGHYIAHGVRRGTAQSHKGTGAPLEGVASGGLWSSPAFRAYSGLPADVEKGVRNLSRPTRSRSPTPNRPRFRRWG